MRRYINMCNIRSWNLFYKVPPRVFTVHRGPHRKRCATECGPPCKQGAPRPPTHLVTQGHNDLAKQPPSHPAIEPPVTEMASAGARSVRLDFHLNIERLNLWHKTAFCRNSPSKLRWSWGLVKPATPQITLGAMTDRVVAATALVDRMLSHGNVGLC